MGWHLKFTNSRWGRTRGTGLAMSVSLNLLTIRETAAELRVSVATIERVRKRGDLPRVKVGYATRILRRDIENYIEAHRDGAA
ncbi:helix-turn-helix domain-containing protein [Nocardioides sp.]|uniref:helix-turn-helix domain-containing protein n=1 Tax=Nocardioides sp. TaxID=35761 RepID=UPI00261F36FE|nr:helix-turn-helix domain-containing protein [Nocardioides sp.]